VEKTRFLLEGMTNFVRFLDIQRGPYLLFFDIFFTIIFPKFSSHFKCLKHTGKKVFIKV